MSMGILLFRVGETRTYNSEKQKTNIQVLLSSNKPLFLRILMSIFNKFRHLVNGQFK